MASETVCRVFTFFFQNQKKHDYVLSELVHTFPRTLPPRSPDGRRRRPTRGVTLRGLCRRAPGTVVTSLVSCRTCPVVKVTASFTSSDSQGFVLSDELGLTTDDPPTVNVRERELVYRSLPDGEYYWELPDSFTGNKVRYGDCVSLRSMPVHLHRQNSPV